MTTTEQTPATETEQTDEIEILSEGAIRELTIGDIGAATHTGGSVHLDDAQTLTYEDAGPAGDAMRRKMGELCRGLCERDDVRSIELYAEEGYVLEVYSLAR